MPLSIPKIVIPLLNLLNNKKKSYYIKQYISFIKIDFTNQFIISNDIYYLIYKKLKLNKNNETYINNINNAIYFFRSNVNLPSYYALRDTFTNILNNEEIKNINIIKKWETKYIGKIKINNIILINNNLYITLLKDSKIQDSFLVFDDINDKEFMSVIYNSSKRYIEYIYKNIKKEYNLKKLNLYFIGDMWHYNSRHLLLKKIFDKAYIVNYSINKGNILKDIEKLIKEKNYCIYN